MIVCLKDGVSLDNTHYKIYMAIGFAAIIWKQHNAEALWVVGGREAGHVTNPDARRQFHLLPDGTCQACDLRTWNIPNESARFDAQRQLARILGPEYDVLYEHPGQKGEHFHVQYDPLRPGTHV